jgi:hypothetical protein
MSSGGQTVFFYIRSDYSRRFWLSKTSSPQSLSLKLTNLLAKRLPIARKYETFPSLLLVHTEKMCGTLPLKFANLGLKDWGQTRLLAYDNIF